MIYNNNPQTKARYFSSVVIFGAWGLSDSDVSSLPVEMAVVLGIIQGAYLR
jgi:hypothetical protein